jgi:hypothetical protein
MIIAPSILSVGPLSKSGRRQIKTPTVNGWLSATGRP